MLKVSEVVHIPNPLLIYKGIDVIDEFKLVEALITPLSDITKLTPENLRSFILNEYWRSFNSVLEENDKYANKLKDWELENCLFARKNNTREHKESVKAKTLESATALYWRITELKDPTNQNILIKKRKLDSNSQNFDQDPSGTNQIIEELQQKIINAERKQFEAHKEALELMRENVELKNKLKCQQDSIAVGIMCKTRSILEGHLDSLLMMHKRASEKHLDPVCRRWVDEVLKDIESNRTRKIKTCIKDSIVHHCLDCTFFRRTSLRSQLECQLRINGGQKIVQVPLSFLEQASQNLYSSMCEIHLTGPEEEAHVVIPPSRQLRFRSDHQSLLYQILTKFFKLPSVQFL
jgi:hypothetical protein